MLRPTWCSLSINDVVNEVFHVVHLVGRDDHGAFFVHVGRDGPPKLGFRRDVEPIGRFVHEEKARACGEGETDIRFLSCPVERALKLTSGDKSNCRRFSSNSSSEKCG